MNARAWFAAQSFHGSRHGEDIHRGPCGCIHAPADHRYIAPSSTGPEEYYCAIRGCDCPNTTAEVAS